MVNYSCWQSNKTNNKRPTASSPHFSSPPCSSATGVPPCFFFFFSFLHYSPLCFMSSQCPDSCFNGQQSVASQQERSNQAMKKMFMLKEHWRDIWGIRMNRGVRRVEQMDILWKYSNGYLSCEARVSNAARASIMVQLAEWTVTWILNNFNIYSFSLF